MKDRLWKFTSDDGSFVFPSAHTVGALYLPLANELLMSSITPTLHGDIKTDQDHFLLEPVSRIDLVNSRVSRNFWVYRSPELIWSAAGVSKDRRLARKDRVTLKGGLLWQEVERTNRSAGLRSEILSFVPSGNLPFEVMRVRLTNISRSRVTITPTAAIPLYARGAHSIRDHRHVTSLLQRVILSRYGVCACPTLHFDESGHRPNKTLYCVMGWDELGRPPEYIYPTQEMFCGCSGDLEQPEAVYGNLPPDTSPIQGREAMGGLRFSRRELKPGQSISYVVLMGITDDRKVIERARRALGTLDKVHAAWQETRAHWLAIARSIRIETHDRDLDNWFHWVAVQPALRRIYGCSFLPDFDYGKGGRGWRDLWQDCLGLILSDPHPVRRLLLNNFSGVRIDGTNATIIGKDPGEFISDRNNIPRVWMDHGVWPLFTLDLYLQETGDSGILFEKTGYFADRYLHRSKVIDDTRSHRHRMRLLTRSGRPYLGSIIEHLLVQHLTAFFRVGEHNRLLLEGADWNDGLDMASHRGESVAFSCFYASNLRLLADILEKSAPSTIEIARELDLLLKRCDYGSIMAKRRLLDGYFKKVQPRISGATVKVSTAKIIKDLRAKASWMLSSIRKSEWLEEGFFNGYYDDRGRRVEGASPFGLRMMLTSQVFALLSGAADDTQAAVVAASIRRHLRDKATGGIHLNTDFRKEQHHLGRAFSFVYGDKENGAYFNHMAVMYVYALYTRGLITEAWEVFSSIWGMALDSARSRIYPCLPEYFDISGRGMYSYLTGSASWFVLTMLTRVFGIRGVWGDLMIDPRFSSSVFLHRQELLITRTFAGRRFHIIFINRKKLSYGKYVIREMRLGAQRLALPVDSHARIERRLIEALSPRSAHTLTVVLDSC